MKETFYKNSVQLKNLDPECQTPAYAWLSKCEGLNYRIKIHECKGKTITLHLINCSMDDVSSLVRGPLYLRNVS